MHNTPEIEFLFASIKCMISKGVDLDRARGTQIHIHILQL